MRCGKLSTLMLMCMLMGCRHESLTAPPTRVSDQQFTLTMQDTAGYDTLFTNCDCDVHLFSAMPYIGAGRADLQGDSLRIHIALGPRNGIAPTDNYNANYDQWWSVDARLTRGSTTAAISDLLVTDAELTFTVPNGPWHYTITFPVSEPQSPWQPYHFSGDLPVLLAVARP